MVVYLNWQQQAFQISMRVPWKYWGNGMLRGIFSYETTDYTALAHNFSPNSVCWKLFYLLLPLGIQNKLCPKWNKDLEWAENVQFTYREDT